MSFLSHDMTPTDPLTYYRPGRGYSATPSDRPNPRLPRYDPVTLERGAPPSALLLGANGRLSSVHHFNPGGQHLDGTHRQHVPTAPAALQSQSTFVPDGPSSVFFGVSTNRNSSSMGRRTPLFDEPPSRKEYEKRAKEELQYFNRMQSAELQQRKRDEAEDFRKPVGFILEKGFSSADAHIPKTRISRQISEPRKYLEKSMVVEMSAPTHKHVLEPLHSHSPEDFEYRSELQSQMEQSQNRRDMEYEYNYEPSQGFGEILHNHKTKPNPRLSREGTAVTSLEKQQLSRENKAQRSQKLAIYREELQRQIEDSKKRSEDFAPLESYSSFSPVDSSGKHLRLRSQEANIQPLLSKVTETAEHSQLYERQVDQDIPIGERLGKHKGDPRPNKYGKDEMEERERRFQSRRETLDALRKERDEMQRRLKENEKHLGNGENPFHHSSPERPAKFRSHLNHPGEDNMDDKIKKHRETKKDEFRKNLQSVAQERVQMESQSKQNERELDQQLKQEDLWKWNHDMLERETRHHEIREDEEAKQYLNDLDHQIVDKRQWKSDERNDKLNEERIHVDNSLDVKMKLNQLHAKKRPKGLKSIRKEVMTTDPPGTVNRHKKDHVAEIIVRYE